MGASRHQKPSLTTVTALALLLFVSASAIVINPTRQLSGGETEDSEEMKRTGWPESLNRFLVRTRLNGPGSSPPTCRSKCGGCEPCSPVHVPIPPALNTPLEYYPEAWRCKCGGKLFGP